MAIFLILKVHHFDLFLPIPTPAEALPVCPPLAYAWSVSTHTAGSAVGSVSGPSGHHSGRRCSDTGCRSGNAGDPGVLPQGRPSGHDSGD